MSTLAASPAYSVLVVEDDRDVLQAFVQTLEDEGYTTATARNGREALAVLRSSATLGTAPKLILLDLMMPVMDGWEFRDEQRKDPQLEAIPVVVVSADASVRARADAIGVQGFLRKPVGFDALVDTVRRFCK